MSFLFDGPTPLDALALGTVVHIGAGSGGVLDAYADLQVGRLLLVEGDPDTALDLQAAVAGRPGVDVLAAVVAPGAGPMAWHRYNLASLNGPLDTAGLASAYPRLRALGARTVDAVALGALLRAQLPAAHGPHLLVLDVPGQEPALLASLPGDLLRRFGWIVLRSRGTVAGADAPHGGDTAAALRREGFAAIDMPGTPEPLWPLTLWRFDEDAYRWRCLRDELVSTEEARSALDEQLAHQRDECGRLQHSLAQARAESAARQRQVEELTLVTEVMASDTQLRQSELEQQLAGTAARVAELQRQAEETRRQWQSETEAERAAHATALAMLQQQLQQAMADASAASARQAEDAATLANVKQALDAERQAHEATRVAARETLAQQQRQAQDSAEAAAAASQSELAAVRAAAQKELEAERAAHAQTRNGLQQQQTQAQAAIDAGKAREAELAATVQAVRQDLAGKSAAHAKATSELLQQLSDMTQRAHQLQERVAQQEKAREGLERLTAERMQIAKDDAHRANQAVALSLKLQMLREADLKDLQGRYQHTLAQQKSQQELLTKLAQRLTVANQYFHELSNAQQLASAPVKIPDAPSPRKRRVRPKPDPAAS